MFLEVCSNRIRIMMYDKIKLDTTTRRNIKLS